MQAVTGADAYYNLKPEPNRKYLVDDVIEDTYVDVVADGFIVHLFVQDVFGCGQHPTYAIDFHLTHNGQILQGDKRALFQLPDYIRECVD